ncbi:L-serine ammonia-lyase, iron-sulfur-dependent, subunit alpha [Caldisalinibacter kiritimatiensis]|uniref:L-serine dehydratase n=1 Tax=Caldisalinibacter kiritimatiensis TaxID=1304284 RepID=R1AX04_9FIRM|nr:L-serine ammonia-lyase, iron-sulfur-dependent, subunit alpha [Caldisalinibacter kiritimatiensis]EOD01192.1 L-serine dehydratase, alpha subunit [Caldisalinibacter kiritimatiensis]
MYNSGKELLTLTKERNCKISEIVIEKECKLTGLSINDVRNKMKNNLEVMRESAKLGLEQDIKSVGGIIGGDAKRVNDYRMSQKTLCGDTINKAMARALSCSEVNASMGRICAAPTAGSAGIIPATIITASEVLNSTDEEIINALFTASGIGEIIAKNATLSGAEGGCQAECGSASAMAAAAIVEMAGGSPEMSLHAAATAIKNVMGLICDPIAGLVEAPCTKRNASGTINALLSADLALAGVKSIIPFDEVIEAMYKVGKSLPHELRETALGGVAATETGIKIKEKIFGK